jgi:hypothetical protein
MVFLGDLVSDKILEVRIYAAVVIGLLVGLGLFRLLSPFRLPARYIFSSTAGLVPGVLAFWKWKAFLEKVIGPIEDWLVWGPLIVLFICLLGVYFIRPQNR